MDTNSMIPVLDGEALHVKMANARHSRKISVFEGGMDYNLATEQAATHYVQNIAVTSPAWKESDKRAGLHDRINSLRAKLKAQENASQGYNPRDVADLIGAYFIDIVRLSDETPDYTSVLTTVFSRPNMPKDINLRDFLPYTGKEMEIRGSNDSVPLIEQATADKIPISLSIKAFGHKSSLFNMAFNPFWDVNRLMETVASIRVDSRNDDVIGAIVRAEYDAAHMQAADTEGETRDLRVYNTIDDALSMLYGLYHPQFDTRKIGTMNPRIYLLINPMDVRKTRAVISGGLVGAGGLKQIVNALPIDGIIPYSGGIQDGLSWGKEVLKFPGVKEGEFYLVAVTPYGGMTFTKRDLTLETGTGSVLQLSREERAWYRIGATFLDWLIGKTVGSKAYGGIIKGKLPEK